MPVSASGRLTRAATSAGLIANRPSIIQFFRGLRLPGWAPAAVGTGLARQAVLGVRA